ncbi:MAG: hypothetical protein ACOC8E_00485 [Planctomycetota bacterium]
MWPIGISPGPPRRQRGAALCIAALLISVLSVFLLAAVDYYLSRLDSDRGVMGEARALYLAELGRADATAYIINHPGSPWPHTRSLTTVCDDLGDSAGEYTYTITKPTGNWRRVSVSAYWPSHAEPVGSCDVEAWLHRKSSVWRCEAWTDAPATVDGGG